ncbi:MAG TPA: hypothetical protein VE954_16125 [Oligoflexus sp.]|uniref:hypothetical protein n=1 Tax=Oligoflexus sp. TaxID=1971216 RepID=UPI002D6C4561|nr:hypothetical protein [Oligoflexus sp.]HYX34628.1 hypothetical protein [Oligoflexus sp.]
MRSAFVLAAILVTACGPSVDPGSHLSGRTSLQDRYPLSPQTSLTPGTTCKNASEYRYPERIPYCNRSVSTSLKNKIIKTYDSTFQYTIASMPRNDFKIDHYIPLCMGGSNDNTNLWPQHKSAYAYTDLLEQKLCLHMERGHMRQVAAIDYMKYAKNNLDEAERIDQEVDEIYGEL